MAIFVMLYALYYRVMLSDRKFRITFRKPIRMYSANPAADIYEVRCRTAHYTVHGFYAGNGNAPPPNVYETLEVVD